MKILLAEHEAFGHASLRDLLLADGHEVLLSSRCEETLARFDAMQPELSLLHTNLPARDGYHCAREIGLLSGTEFAPVMLLTDPQHPLDLERFVQCGAMDFIDIGTEPSVLRARIAAYQRSRQIHLDMALARSRMQHEVKLARHMFNSVIRRSPVDPENLQHWMLSAGHFSGDLLLYERTPDGDLHVLLCDFTGHGLSAAVGALPTSDVFFAMTGKGCGLGEIAAEINRKLNLLMPTGHFCAATLCRLSPAHDALEVWNGGQPPVLLLDVHGHPVAGVASAHFPLGVMPPARFDATTQVFHLSGIRHAVLCSDGVLEARNSRGEMFGNEGLRRALHSARNGGVHVLQTIKRHVVHFLDGLEPHDDVSLLTLDLNMAAR